MKWQKDDRILEIEQDMNPMNPREWDNLGVMVCFHKRYNLGDDTLLRSGMFDGWDQLEEYLYNINKAEIVYPLHLMDHSGLTMKIGEFGGLYGYWDSGQVGFIYTTKEKIRQWFGKQRISTKTRKLAEKALIGEINTYNIYLRGDIHHVTLYKVIKCDLGYEHLEILDSSCGFIGLDLDYIAETFGITDIDSWTEYS